MPWQVAMRTGGRAGGGWRSADCGWGQRINTLVETLQRAQEPRVCTHTPDDAVASGPEPCRSGLVVSPAAAAVWTAVMDAAGVGERTSQAGADSSAESGGRPRSRRIVDDSGSVDGAGLRRASRAATALVSDGGARPAAFPDDDADEREVCADMRSRVLWTSSALGPAAMAISRAEGNTSIGGAGSASASASPGARGGRSTTWTANESRPERVLKIARSSG